jgi:predicted tellurium resistance membrane protein TerC
MIDWSLPLGLEHLFTLGMLVLLQAVLGFDNLLYISLESKRVVADKQSFVRKTGIGIAIILRIVLLFVILIAIGSLQKPFFEYGLEPAVAHVEHGSDTGQATASGDDHAHEDEEAHADDHAKGGHHVLRKPNEEGSIFAGAFNAHSVITLLGGIFIIYTAFKEIMHMLAIHHIDGSHDSDRKRGVAMTIAWIVLMNLVFSFDSILSAIAPMAKSTFYFVIAIMVAVDVIQTRYQRKLLAAKAHEAGGHA